MHVVQYQKNEDDGPNKGSPDYLIEVSLSDNEGKPIVLLNCDNCGYTGRVVAPDGSTQSIESTLSFPMKITVGDVVAMLYYSATIPRIEAATIKNIIVILGVMTRERGRETQGLHAK